MHVFRARSGTGSVAQTPWLLLHSSGDCLRACVCAGRASEFLSNDGDSGAAGPVASASASLPWAESGSLPGIGQLRIWLQKRMWVLVVCVFPVASLQRVDSRSATGEGWGKNGSRAATQAPFLDSVVILRPGPGGRSP